MRLLFITGLYPQQLLEQLRECSNGNIANAPNVFQWNVVRGLRQNNANFDIVSLPFLPAFPKRFKKLFVPQSPICIDDSIIGDSLSYCDLLVWKTCSMQIALEKYLLDWIKKYDNERKLVILTYTPYVPFLRAINKVRSKYPHKVIEVVSIVTDLVDDMMSFSSNRTILKRIQCYIETRQTKKLYKSIDKFVLLSKHMVDKIPEARDSFMVMEGLAECGEFVDNKNSEVRTLLYTGTLQAYSGVADLVEAFKRTTSPDFRLVICGAGSLQDMIIQATNDDSRIIFRGLVTREESVKLQCSSTLLVNPRKPNNEITKYSFPSKTMEYLSSGTPMLGYKLEGIPEEYYEYYYTIDELDINSLTERIQDVLSLSESELNLKAEKAREFILQHKTARMQIYRLLDFINK